MLPSWLVFIRLILANDIETNPGFSNSFFTFCNWNINSLAKDNFSRVQLLEAHNTLYKYDLISLCETSLNNTVEIPEPLLENYTFISKNNPNNTRHGGVGLFYKNSLPLFVRDDLAFNETLVVELRFGKRKIFFTVLYRSPSQLDGSIEFQTFLNNFENLVTKIRNENPFSMFFVAILTVTLNYGGLTENLLLKVLKLKNLLVIWDYFNLYLSQPILSPTKTLLVLTLYSPTSQILLLKVVREPL